MKVPVYNSCCPQSACLVFHGGEQNTESPQGGHAEGIIKLSLTLYMALPHQLPWFTQDTREASRVRD